MKGGSVDGMGSVEGWFCCRVVLLMGWVLLKGGSVEVWFCVLGACSVRCEFLSEMNSWSYVIFFSSLSLFQVKLLIIIINNNK